MSLKAALSSGSEEGREVPTGTQLSLAGLRGPGQALSLTPWPPVTGNNLPASQPRLLPWTRCFVSGGKSCFLDQP